MHFRRFSAKIQPKNLKLDHYYFLAVRGNIRLLGVGPLGFPLATPLTSHWFMLINITYFLSIAF